MKCSAIALVLGVVVAGPAFGAPGDPRLIQRTLEWPATLSGGEPLVVLRGDDARVYYADVTVAQRHVQGSVSAGSRIALLGLEGTKPHEILAVALGSGDAAALSLTLAQAAPPTPPTPAGVAPSSAAPAAVPPAAGEKGRRVTVRGSVNLVAGPTLFLKQDDGSIVVVDISKLDRGAGSRLRPGSSVTRTSEGGGIKLR
jgi:hypothetical protein